jgi:hypothetical protein
MSTTMTAVRILGNLLKDKALGPRLVPIVADEARTFGMANLFRQVGIYSPVGQLYEPEDAGSMLSYRESRGRAATRRRHHGGWCARLVDRRGDVLQRQRPRDAAVLHLLLDVRLPACRRSDLGGSGPARAGLPAGCDGGPHDARRRRAAAPGRQQPPGRGDRSELPRLRSRVRRRARRDPRSRCARDDGAAGRRVLLRPP